jgi:hypothetical protein
MKTLPVLAQLWLLAALPWPVVAGEPPVPTATAKIVETERGDLKIVFCDNSNSPKVLSGLDSLLNIKHAPNFDAFDPDGKGASAGLNFEHIISGHRNPNNKFTPRSGPYVLHLMSDFRGVQLVRRAEDDPWKVASTFTYRIVEPHFVDFEFHCTPQEAQLFAERGWAIFFFANYMNDVTDVALHFRGQKEAAGAEEWIAADAPPGPADWNTGGTYRHVDAEDLKYDDDQDFRLNNWSYGWPRFTQPFYYGRAAHGMTLILMFDRAYSADDEIRFSLFKFKLPKHPRPAWDFQYVVHQVESGREYGFRGRLAWKKFIDEDDVMREYETWRAALQKSP